MSERFKIEVIDKYRGVPTCLHVIDTQDDDEIVFVCYSMSEAEAYVGMHSARPSLAETGVAQTRHMLAEVEAVCAVATVRIAEDTETLRRAEDLKARLNARLDRLSASLLPQNASETPEGGADGPRTFLADLTQYATVQQMNAALLYKPMPY